MTFWRARSFWVAALAVAYAAFAALQASGGRGPAWLALVGLPLALAAAWSITSSPLAIAGRALSDAQESLAETSRAATRACVTGAAMLVAAKTGPDAPSLIALGNLGAAIAATSALVALARIPPLGGLIEPPAEALRLETAAFGSLFWTIAVALPVARAVAPERTAELDPAALDYATVAASLGSLGVMLFALVRTRARRRLELGIGDRVSAALWLTVTALGVGVLAAATGVAPPDKLLPPVSTVASLFIVWCATAAEPTSVSRALGIILAVAVPASPIALFAVYISYAAPGYAGAVAFLACAACAVAGLAAPLVGRLFAPEGARWLKAFDAATEAAMNPDPDAALEAALTQLRDAAQDKRGFASTRLIEAGDSPGGAPQPPALYRLQPPELVTVDLAGYVHVERAEVPARLIELAEAEPERILRTEVVRAVQVRRPEVRPLLAWMEQRGIGAACVVRDALGSIGVLSVPRPRRSSPMAIDEVRALRTLADRMGAVIGVSAMLARSREREHVAREELGARRAEVTRLEAALTRGATRFQALARILERPARAAAYSPAARAAVEQLERLGESGRPITLLAAPGVDAVAWAALAHLASPRNSGALAIIDGASPAEADLLRWRDPSDSPLKATSDGTLVILDAHALPMDVQSYIGAALPEDVGLIVAVPATADSLVAAGKLSERLADRLGDRAVALPELASRAEDLRALSLEHLARIGTRLGRGALGLDIRAQAALGEHLWPGNEVELYSVLLRAALVAEGDVIGVSELRAIGFPTTGRDNRDMMTVGATGGRSSGGTRARASSNRPSSRPSSKPSPRAGDKSKTRSGA